MEVPYFVKRNNQTLALVANIVTSLCVSFKNSILKYGVFIF